MTINHGGQMPPAVLPTRNVSHIHGPASIALGRSTPPTLDTRAWCPGPLMYQPALQA
ncbi:MAG: hypothetical protein AB7T38_00020 [Nitrospirales bacterium]